MTGDAVEHFDVLIVGAGLSGIGAAYHVQTRFPHKRYAIFEAREAIGGTWDLFRYPGVRSDSDMYTLGYRFRPWLEANAIADAPSILQYIRDTATQYNIDRHIRFQHRLTRASWSSADARWTLEVAVTDAKDGTVHNRLYTCRVLYNCTGYYDYAQGYLPEFPGASQFRGQLVHPQAWPEALDYRDKRVVVIGSGATAVTLVPAMAKQAAHVTMLQRSPTYVVSRPSRDAFSTFARRWLPQSAAYWAARWKNVAFTILTYGISQRYPQAMKNLLVSRVQQEVGPQFDVATHFTPRYKPWDQRMCLVPDSDLFLAIKSGAASVVTSEIDTFTEAGIRLTSGEELPADIVVTATGLNLRLLAGIEVLVDGHVMHIRDRVVYKGMMLSDIPNFVSAFGYTNASWTLKCDLTAEYTCRLMAHADKRGFRQFTPRQRDPLMKTEPPLRFTSGYVQRAADRVPSQGLRTPWRVHQNYVSDLVALRYGRVDDGVMEFE
jgi:monooxygenase